MTAIGVTCIINRFWDTENLVYDGDSVTGELIEFSTQTDEHNPGKIIPVGIVLLDDGSFLSVPVEFITNTAV